MGNSLGCRSSALPLSSADAKTPHHRYIILPIASMYYFGTNLDKRFSVPNFWPSPEETHRIPFDKEEIKAEAARMRARRLWLKEQREKKERERQMAMNGAQDTANEL